MFIIKLFLFYTGNSSANSSNTIGPLDSFVSKSLATRPLSKSEEALFEKLMI